jgi:hypothetical protein
MRTAKWLNLFVLTALLAVAGCGPSEEEKLAEADAAAKAAFNARKAAAAAKAADPTATMARAVATSKPEAPIDLKYDILGKPIVGEPVEIELALIPTNTGDGMSVVIGASAGLTVSGTLEANFSGVTPGQAVRTRFTAKADKEDAFYVTVATTMHAAGVGSTRTYAIPILTSAPPPPAPAEGEAAAAAPKADKK